MLSRRRLLVLSLLVVLVAASLFAGIRRRGFRQQIDREVAELLAARTMEESRTVRETDLEGLPSPVQSWLRSSGVVGKAIPSVVRITQQGEFRLGADKPWMPLRATEYYTTNPPSFLWDASMQMFPLIDVTGRDRYADGAGAIEMRLASLISVANKSGGDLNSGALLRYLNETMWFPAALLLPNVTWDAIDDAHARATLTDAGQSVSAIFVFDDRNRLVNMTADRWNDAEQAMLPWSTPLSDWGTAAGLQLATAGNGVWNTGPDAYEYIRIHLTSVEYDPAGIRS